MGGFVIVEKNKCESKDDAYKVLQGVQRAKNCWNKCKKQKRCAMAQYNEASKKCALWKKGECKRTLKESKSDFAIAVKTKSFAKFEGSECARSERVEEPPQTLYDVTKQECL